jgi:cardiolipin synthase
MNENAEGRQARYIGGLPAFDGNAVELLPDYLAALECIAQEIDRAQRFVHIEYFAPSSDEDTQCVFAAMERAHQRGVKVRVLLDHLGSRKNPNFKKMRKWFTEAGIQYHLSLPLRFFGSRYTRFDLRNHRKIVVIDGQGRAFILRGLAPCRSENLPIQRADPAPLQNDEHR